MAKTFTLGDKEFEVRAPQGKKGRVATAKIVPVMSSVDTDDIGAFMRLLGDEEFESVLPDFLGVSRDVLDENGTIMDILRAILLTIEEIFGSEEVAEAVKN